MIEAKRINDERQAQLEMERMKKEKIETAKAKEQ